MNAAFPASGVVATVGHERLACTLYKSVVRQSIIGKKMMSSGFLAWILYSRLCTCGIPRFAGKHAPLVAFFVKLLAGKIGVDQVLRFDSQGIKVAREHGRLRVHVEHARHADAD